MVEPAIVTGLGWLVSPLMKMLLEKGINYLGTGMDKRRKIFGATVHPCISLAIEAVKKSPNKDRLKLWFQRIKDAYYEAKEAIDLFEYELLKQKVMHERKTFRQKMTNQRKPRISISSGFVPRSLKIVCSKLKGSQSIFPQQKIKLKGCIDKLVEIANEAKDFQD